MGARDQIPKNSEWDISYRVVIPLKKSSQLPKALTDKGGGVGVRDYVNLLCRLPNN